MGDCGVPVASDESSPGVGNSPARSRSSASSTKLPSMLPAKLPTNEEQQKITAIQIACAEGNREAVLKQAVAPGGLLTDDVRRQAWPLLLNCSASNDLPDGDENSLLRNVWEELQPHEDENQVKLDVDRAFIYYPRNMSPRELDERKKELSDLIVEVLRKHPMLGYFQGFHDICQVILLVLGPRRAATAVEHIAFLRIRDFMLPSMTPAVNHLHLLYPLLRTSDPTLCAHLSRTQPFFALAATLTLYAHDIQEYGDISRLFDVFLAQDPVFPLYVFAQVVMDRRDELFEISDDEPEMLHSVLSKLPKPLDLEGLISRSVRLLEEHPPEKLPNWHSVSRYSVLKTSRESSRSRSKPEASPTLAEAEALFRLQCRQLEQEKRRKEVIEAIMKRKPIAIGFSVLVGLTSVALGVYLRRNGGMGTFGIASLQNLLGLMHNTN